MTPCDLVGGYQRFGELIASRHHEDGSDMFLRNVGNHLTRLHGIIIQKTTIHKSEFSW
jgi:hypothetical protein